MDSPFINLMEIPSLKRYSLNPQVGMKGSVVNVVVEVNLEVLPRSFDNMATV